MRLLNLIFKHTMVLNLGYVYKLSQGYMPANTMDQLTASFKALPALKLGILAAAISIG